MIDHKIEKSHGLSPNDSDEDYDEINLDEFWHKMRQYYVLRDQIDELPKQYPDRKSNQKLQQDYLLKKNRLLNKGIAITQEANDMLIDFINKLIERSTAFYEVMKLIENTFDKQIKQLNKIKNTEENNQLIYSIVQTIMEAQAKLKTNHPQKLVMFRYHNLEKDSSDSFGNNLLEEIEIYLKPKGKILPETEILTANSNNHTASKTIQELQKQLKASEFKNEQDHNEIQKLREELILTKQHEENYKTILIAQAKLKITIKQYRWIIFVLIIVVMILGISIITNTPKNKKN